MTEREPDQPGPTTVVLDRVTLFTVLGALLPGLGLIAARRRVAGGVVLGVFVLGAGALAVWALTDVEGLVAYAVSPARLRGLIIALALVGVAWVAVIVLTHLALRGTPPRGLRKIINSALVAVLAFGVAAPTAVAARYAYDSATAVTTIFQTESQTRSATKPTAKPTTAKDPWKDIPRVNILLLGGDSDGGKRPGVRTDTVIVASIDTKTGNTVLISLPRNTSRIPFPKGSPLRRVYPNGFVVNDSGVDPHSMLNAMYGDIPVEHPGILGPTDNLGADAMKLAVGEGLGLKIDYYVLIDIVGLRQLINALGGITVNINYPVPIGGDYQLNVKPRGYLQPGADQHLSGAQALWFARGRYGLADGDYDRMDRQRCLIDAMVRQANPANVVTRYEAIVRASTSLIRTDIPQEALPAFVELSMRVKQGNLRSLVFKNAVAGFKSARPDWALARKRVRASIGEAAAPSAPSAPSSSRPTTGTSTPPKTPTTTATGPGSSAPASEDTGDACAYHPV